MNPKLIDNASNHLAQDSYAPDIEETEHSVIQKTFFKQHLSLLLFISVCFIWGTTWLAMEMAVKTIPPVFATGLRFLIASPLLILLARLSRQPLSFPKGQKHWMPVVALFYFAIPFTLMIFGEQYISSGLASIIFANMPIAVMVTSRLFLGLRLRKIQIAGLLVAVLSLILILTREMSIGGSDYLLGFLALGSAVIIHAVMYVLVQKHCDRIPVLTYNAFPSLIASAFLLAASFIIEQPAMDSFSTSGIAAVVYLGLFASVGGIVAYFKLGKVSTPFTASMCFLLFPLIALTLSSWIAGNPVSMMSVSLLLPLLGGIFVTRAEPSFWTSFRAMLRSPGQLLRRKQHRAEIKGINA